jgi:hypothetical protein
MIAVYIIAALAVLYGIFIVGPALISFKKIFEKKSDRPLDDMDISKTYFAPFEQSMRDAADRVEKSCVLQRVQTTSFDGLTLYADYIDNNSDKTVAFFHGYRATPMVNFSIHTEIFVKAGYNVLLVFQRGHSVSGGENNTLGLKERYDVLSWVDFLDGYPAKNVVLYGISMGASTIAYASPLIKSEKVKALVIDCGFVSPWLQIYRDCVRRRLPGKLIMPIVNFLCKRKFGEDLKTSVSDALKDNKIPAFFLHGKADETVPYNDAELNYSACGSEKKILLPDGLHHTLAFSTGDDSVRAEVFDFINNYIK